MTTHEPTVTVENHDTPQARHVIDWRGPAPQPNDTVLMSVELFEQCIAILNGEA
jgi:hypothetical protein